MHLAPGAAVYHLKSPSTHSLTLPLSLFYLASPLPFGEKETERGSQNSLNSPNDMKVMKVIRAMLPWTSRPIMAYLTFTQGLEACELWCLPHCVSVSASHCLSLSRSSMSNSVSAHTTGLRERADQSSPSSLRISPRLYCCCYFQIQWCMKDRERERKNRFHILLEKWDSPASARNRSVPLKTIEDVKGQFQSHFLLLFPAFVLLCTTSIFFVCLWTRSSGWRPDFLICANYKVPQRRMQTLPSRPTPR